MGDQPEREMRRKERRTSEEEARELLSVGEYGVLSTVDASGEPYGVPLSYVYRDGEIFFHSAPEGRKVENLGAGALASFCVVGETEVQPEMFSTRYQSAIASGEIYELAGEDKTSALGWLVEKYAPAFLGEGQEYIASSQDKTRVFALRVSRISGKRRH